MNTRLCGYLKAFFIIAIMALSVWIFVTNTELYILKYIVCLFVFRLASISIHEISHFFAFIIFNIKVTAFKISVFKIEKANDKYKICIENNKLFSGECTWIYNSSVASYKYIIALCAGSVSNLLISIVCIILLITNSFNIEPLLLFFICLYNFALNFLNPQSTDRNLIRIIKNRQRDVQ